MEAVNQTKNTSLIIDENIFTWCLPWINHSDIYTISTLSKTVYHIFMCTIKPSVHQYIQCFIHGHHTSILMMDRIYPELTSIISWSAIKTLFMSDHISAQSTYDVITHCVRTNNKPMVNILLTNCPYIQPCNNNNMWIFHAIIHRYYHLVEYFIQYPCVRNCFTDENIRWIMSMNHPHIHNMLVHHRIICATNSQQKRLVRYIMIDLAELYFSKRVCVDESNDDITSIQFMEFTFNHSISDQYRTQLFDLMQYEDIQAIGLQNDHNFMVHLCMHNHKKLIDFMIQQGWIMHVSMTCLHVMIHTSKKHGHLDIEDSLTKILIKRDSRNHWFSMMTRLGGALKNTMYQFLFMFANDHNYSI
jgi:hypothetical protein